MFSWRRRTVLDVEAVEFASRAICIEHHRLRVCWCSAVGGGHDPGLIDSRRRLQYLSEFITFAVFADDRDWQQPADSECSEIIDDRAQRARVRTNSRHLIRRESGLD